MNLSLGSFRPGRALLALAVFACAPAAPPPAAPPPAAEPRPATDARLAVRLGVLLPSGGPEYARQYADAVLEGVEVAVAQRREDPRYRIETVVREGGTPEQTAAAVRALAAEGVVAIVAPVFEPDVAAAAAARPDSALAILSPTGTTRFRSLPRVYALNVPDTLGAAALGEHVARAGLAPVGVLHARNPAAEAQARGFTVALAAAGGRVALELSYEPGTTTFGTVLRRLRDAKVRSIFLAADERDVRQILPQVRYYGLESAQVVATGSWATPDGVARIGLPALEGAIITLPFLSADSAGGWQRFARAYAEHFRRSLDNALPALGYDAAQLALEAVSGRPTARSVATVLAAGREVNGATGQLRTVRGAVLRRPLLVRVLDGRLIPLNPR